MAEGIGRGTLYLFVSQIIFMLGGYAIHFGLGRYLGPEVYGIFGVILSLMTTINLFLTSGIPAASSKFLAEPDSNIREIMRKTRTIELIFSVIVFIIYLSLSDFIASEIFNDPSLAPYIAFSSLAIPAYAIYIIYSSFLNGLREFWKQAKAQIIQSIIRVGSVFALVYIGFGIYGAIGGYIVAQVLSFFIIFKFVKDLDLRHSSNSISYSAIINFAFPAMFLSLVMNLLLNLGLFSVKSILGSNLEAGYYTSANTLSLIIFYASGALALTLLPAISRSISIGDKIQTRSYIVTSLRYMLIILIPIVFIISGTSTEIIDFAYDSEYLPAAGTLSILVFGILFLSIIHIFSTIIMGAGRPKVALALVTVILAINFLLNFFLIPIYGIQGAAFATTLSALLGIIYISYYIRYCFGGPFRVLSLMRVTIASFAIYLIAIAVEVPLILLPFFYIGLLCLYAILLYMMKEINSEDIGTIKRIIFPRP